MVVKGTFEIRLDPQQDDSAPAGRMVINKTYSDGLVGTGIGQMLSKRTENGASVYSAIEEFQGSVDGKSGSFTLFHNGIMSSTKHELKIIVVDGSATGELEGLTGELLIEQQEGVHHYTFTYGF
jgi:hypothetical protein